MRLDRLEHSSLAKCLTNPIGVSELISRNLASLGIYQWIIDRLDKVTPERVAQQRKVLLSIDELDDSRLTEESAKAIPRKHRELFKELLELLPVYLSLDGDAGDISIEDLVDIRVEHEGEDDQPYLKVGMEVLKDRASQYMWASARLDELRGIVSDIKEERLVKHLNSGRTARVNDDLSRAFFRVLSELRRQQQWRREMDVVDVSHELQMETVESE